MNFVFAFLFSLLLSCSSGRVISRTGPSGYVNLVEFNIGGVIHGRCSFRSSSGEEIMVIYEENGQEQLSAKSSNPTVVDPLAKALECRQTAANPLPNELQGRSDIENGEISQAQLEAQLQQQFADFDRSTQLNQEYVSQLQPRFLKKIIGLGLGLKALGSLSGQQQQQYGDEQQHGYQSPPTISFGGLGGDGYGGGGSLFPGIHIVRHLGGGYGNDQHQGYDQNHGIGYLQEDDSHRYAENSHSIGSLVNEPQQYEDHMHGVGSILETNDYGHSGGYHSYGGVKHPLAALSGLFG